MSLKKLAVLEQLERAGLLAECRDLTVTGESVRFRASLAMRSWLARSSDFAEGPWSLLHSDVGPRRLDYRSYPGTFGPGSLQIVLAADPDEDIGNDYSDIDRWNPYADVVNIVGHLGFEVIPPVLAGLWRRLRGKERSA